jgi:hypothetical protein
MKININDEVKVKLTENGREIYFHKDDEHRKQEVAEKGYYPPYFQPQYPRVDDEGYTTFQIWELMQIYGKHINVCSLPFKNTEMIVIQQDLKI